MKTLAALALPLCLAGGALAADSPANAVATPQSPALPADAAEVVDRVAACFHFSGEFNGDQSERDKEVTRAMTELRCETIDQEASAIRRKYAGHQDVQDALAAATEL